VQHAIADPDFFADRRPARAREIERVEPDDVLQVIRVDARVARDAEHLARGRVDEHRTRARIGKDRAVGHRFDSDLQLVRPDRHP
jgi:hypothetical protein